MYLIRSFGHGLLIKTTLRYSVFINNNLQKCTKYVMHMHFLVVLWFLWTMHYHDNQFWEKHMANNFPMCYNNNNNIALVIAPHILVASSRALYIITLTSTCFIPMQTSTPRGAYSTCSHINSIHSQRVMSGTQLWLSEPIPKWRHSSDGTRTRNLMIAGPASQCCYLYILSRKQLCLHGSQYRYMYVCGHYRLVDVAAALKP